MTVKCVWELQQAIYAALNGDATLGAMINGVFDHVPQDTEYPYVTIGEMRASDYSTKTTAGVQIDFSVNVYSRGKGSKSCLDIITRVNDLLHDVDLTLATCEHINTRFVSSDIIRRPDGLTYHGVINFRVVVQE